MEKNTSHRVVALALAAFVLAGACGSRDSGPTTPAPTSPVPTSPVPPPRTVPPPTSEPPSVVPTTVATTAPPTTTPSPNALVVADQINIAMGRLSWIRVVYEEHLMTPEGEPVQTIRWEGAGSPDGGDGPVSVWWEFGVEIEHTATPARVQPFDYRKFDGVAYQRGHIDVEWYVVEDHTDRPSLDAAVRGRLVLADPHVDKALVDGVETYVVSGTFNDDDVLEEVRLQVSRADSLINRYEATASIPVPESLADSVAAGVERLTRIATASLVTESVEVLPSAPPLDEAFGYAPGAFAPVLMEIPRSGWDASLPWKSRSPLMRQVSSCRTQTRKDCRSGL